MKISKLIAELNTIENEYGDIDVVCYDYSESNTHLKNGIIDDDDIKVLFNDKESSDYVEIGFVLEDEKRAKYESVTLEPNNRVHLLGTVEGIILNDSNDKALLELSLYEEEKDNLIPGLNIFIDYSPSFDNSIINDSNKCKAKVVQLFEPIHDGSNNITVLIDASDIIKHLVNYGKQKNTMYVKYEEE